MKLIQTNEEERKRRHLWNKTGKREQGKGNEGRKGRKEKQTKRTILTSVPATLSFKEGR